MKTNVQILCVMLLTLSAYGFAQQEVEVEIQNMTYLSGTPISDCGIIDFADDVEVTVQFGVELKKPSALVVGDGYLKIITKKSASSSEEEEYNQIILSISWTGSTTATFNASLSISIDADDFNATGGVLYARYISSGNVPYNSCNYSIEKDEVPSFSLSPLSATVVCGNTSPKTFSVNPENIPSGSNVVYQWNVGVGWEYQDNAVTNFTTTTTIVQLTPYLFPPSDVKVTPVLDGESYPQLTSDVSLGNFNPFVEIVGDGFVCDVGIYTLNNSINGVSIQFASTSNNNATASVDASAGEITVTRLSDWSISFSECRT